METGPSSPMSPTGHELYQQHLFEIQCKSCPHIYITSFEIFVQQALNRQVEGPSGMTGQQTKKNVNELEINSMV